MVCFLSSLSCLVTGQGCARRGRTKMFFVVFGEARASHSGAVCLKTPLLSDACSLAGHFGKQTVWRPAGRGKPTEALRGYTMLQLVDIACEWDSSRWAIAAVA